VVVKVAQRKKEHNCDIVEGREQLEVDKECDSSGGFALRDSYRFTVT
jgi:hypothetical protein